jgi:hypothetical protein
MRLDVLTMLGLLVRDVLWTRELASLAEIVVLPNIPICSGECKLGSV